MKIQMMTMFLYALFLYSCDTGNARSVDSDSHVAVVNRSETVTVSYDTIDGNRYVHVELPKTMQGVHNSMVCVYEEKTASCCAQWIFEGVMEFWLPYNEVKDSLIRITCWGRFGMRYITAML